MHVVVYHSDCPQIHISIFLLNIFVVQKMNWKSVELKTYKSLHVLRYELIALK